ncbi:MAG: peptidase M23, partial [Elusimicrobia bacterium]
DLGSRRSRDVLQKAYAQMDRQTDAAMGAALRKPLPPPPAPLKRGTLWPLQDGRVTQEFGPSNFYLSPPRNWQGKHYAHFHSGLDIAAPKGTPIAAYDGGKVFSAGPLGACGMSVVIVHPDQVASTYCHMDQGARGPTVRAGQWVNAGDTIGYVGMTGLTTGPHTHFITKKGEIFNPRTVLPKLK